MKDPSSGHLSIASVVLKVKAKVRKRVCLYSHSRYFFSLLGGRCCCVSMATRSGAPPVILLPNYRQHQKTCHSLVSHLVLEYMSQSGTTPGTEQCMSQPGTTLLPE